MKHHLPAPLVRFHVHMRRDHATQLVALTDALAKLKGRDARLGEALELALVAGLSTPMPTSWRLPRTTRKPLTGCSLARSTAWAGRRSPRLN